jgi:hypothetical protein
MGHACYVLAFSPNTVNKELSSPTPFFQRRAATGMDAERRRSMTDDGAWAYGPLLLPKRPEASAPSFLTPKLASHLWCLMPAKGLLGRRFWQRR